jgi:hypothetical protein
MKRLAIIITSFTAITLPALANAVTYAEDGAVLLGDAAEGSAGSNGNLAAALVGADLSLTCLGLVALILVTVYLLHELWHPKRLHEEMTRDEIKAGSIRFYIGGTLVWLLVAIMAEKWCIILPLVIILVACLLYYVYILSSATTDPNL